MPARLLAVLAILAGLLIPATTCIAQETARNRLRWESRLLAPGGRIDALADLGQGVVVCGSRNGRPGHVFRSTDAGAHWTDLGNLLGMDPLGASVTCLAPTGSGVVYLLTGTAHVWKSSDSGATWSILGRVSHNPRLSTFQQSYGLAVLASGTVLVSDTNPTGGHIFRSEDGGKTWHDLGPVSHRALYRFDLTADGVIVNGWAGHVYKSLDDGRTWSDRGQLADSPLYATEYLGDGVVLQGSESGVVFRSMDNGDSWTETARLPGAADDFVSLHRSNVLYSTYTEKQHVFLSHDSGLSWTDVGRVPSSADDDVLDHVISVEHDGRRFAVGGTKRGHVVRLFIDN